MKEIISTAKIVETGNGHILKVGDFYLNSQKEGLYRVSEIIHPTKSDKKVKVDPLYSLKPGGFKRSIDNISGELFNQEVHVLDVKRAIQE
jgi:hypothetical protein